MAAGVGDAKSLFAGMVDFANHGEIVRMSK